MEGKGLEGRIEHNEAQEPYSSRIELSFMRHAQKEKAPEKRDEDILLSPTGREQAMAKDRAANVDQAVAFGTSRKRTRETAALAMAGGEDDIAGDETLEELQEKLDTDLKVGSKIGIDERLNFVLDETTEFGKEGYDAFNKGEYLKFLVENSDALAEKLGDKDSTTYSRAASKIAQVIEKYVQIAPQWDKLVNKEDSAYSETLERFLSSHQGILECFLAKVIEQTKGKKERDEFVELLGNQGFGFAEGFKTDIVMRDGKPEIDISYRKEIDPEHVFEFNEKIDEALLKEIAHS
ncbi:MAG TPA: histidine phosphatase family protein [Candidatus Paceibacterota bacterium]